MEDVEKYYIDGIIDILSKLNHPSIIPNNVRRHSLQDAINQLKEMI